jgi:hypothetical protein
MKMYYTHSIPATCFTTHVAIFREVHYKEYIIEILQIYFNVCILCNAHL